MSNIRIQKLFIFSLLIISPFSIDPWQGRIQGGGAHPARAPLKLEKNIIFWRKIVIFHTKYPKIFAPPSAIGKNKIFSRKIVIFHTKYPNNFRVSFRSPQFF
jgi:hypothetical protein